jgi:hypothetical protein
LVLTAILVAGCSAGSRASTATTAIGLRDEVSTLPDSSSTVQPASATSADEPTTTSTTIPWDGPCGRPVAGPGTYDHVIWIWMENKDRSAIFDSAKAQFLHSLAKACGTASNYVDHGVHPSLPNYIAAATGATQGVRDDGDPRQHKLGVDNIFRQVRVVGKTSKSYEEDMPGNCSLQSTGRYAVKHNPAAYFVGGDDRTACERDDVPFDQFDVDLAGDLPAFSMITPDLCNDMHDCSVATGDKWLADVVTRITSSPTYRQGSTALFIAFDESEGSGTLPFVAVAPSIVPGTVADIQLDHYALLAFTEDALGITDRLGKAAGAPSMARAFGL